MNNPVTTVLKAIGGFFVKLFKDSAPALEESLRSFVSSDVGRIAVDAVVWVAANIPGTATDDEKKNAALAKLADDLKAAGYDALAMGKAKLSWLVESGLQALKEKLV